MSKLYEYDELMKKKKRIIEKYQKASACIDDLNKQMECLPMILGVINTQTQYWQGCDADSFRSKLQELFNDFETSKINMQAALTAIMNEMDRQNEEVIRQLNECRENLDWLDSAAYVARNI